MTGHAIAAALVILGFASLARRQVARTAIFFGLAILIDPVTTPFRTDPYRKVHFTKGDLTLIVRNPDLGLAGREAAAETTLVIAGSQPPWVLLRDQRWRCKRGDWLFIRWDAKGGYVEPVRGVRIRPDGVNPDAKMPPRISAPPIEERGLYVPEWTLLRGALVLGRGDSTSVRAGETVVVFPSSFYTGSALVFGEPDGGLLVVHEVQRPGWYHLARADRWLDPGAVERFGGQWTISVQRWTPKKRAGGRWPWSG